MERYLRILSVIGTIGMFIVLLMGATVTDTGSQTGCGRSWPLCHGNFLPATVRSSVIEFSHRLVTGIIGIVIVALAVLCIRARHKYPALVPLVPLMVGSLLLQSVMGAWAVKYPQSAPILALHFGFSLVAVASVFLVMRVIADEQGGNRTVRKPPATGFKFAAWGSLVTIYAVAYTGAYMKHKGSQGGCRTWPLCSGGLSPNMTTDNGIVAIHRLSALLGTLAIGWIVLQSWRNRSDRPDIYSASMLALLLILAQSVAGMMVVRTDMQLISTLIHAGIMAALFLALCETCRLTLPKAVSQVAERPTFAATSSAFSAD